MTNDPFFVFAYGSLMWRPGFDYIAAEPARLFGAHRALCIYSISHRGTPEKPGLVLGLDRGGSCHGLVYTIEAAQWSATLAYLRTRELNNKVYKEVWRSVTPAARAKRRVKALCYLVDRTNRQYAGVLDIALQVDLVCQGAGNSGANPEYLANTVRHLDEMGIHDPRLTRLHKKVSRALTRPARATLGVKMPRARKQDAAR